ncbi:MAG: GGDEF domain-containing protein, partial [Rhodoferax sp.]|nr:GGDEF domain-containing protein [Rhodoferax sp.]
MAHQSKAAGRNTLRFFLTLKCNPASRPGALKLIARRAFASASSPPHYQAQVDARRGYSGRGAGALAPSPARVGGVPGEFIGPAEAT